jgi:hypothetical protein
LGELSDRLLIAKHSSFCFLFNFEDRVAAAVFGLPGENWRLRLDSSDVEWLGPGSLLPKTVQCSSSNAITLQPWSFAVFERVAEG